MLQTKFAKKTWNSLFVQYSYNTHISLAVFGVVIQNRILFIFFSQLSTFWADFENAHSPFQSYASSKPAVEVEIMNRNPSSNDTDNAPKLLHYVFLS